MADFRSEPSDPGCRDQVRPAATAQPGHHVVTKTAIMCPMQPTRPTMRALAVYPGRPNSMHGREVPRPTVDDVPNGRGVLVRMLQVGVDGTDREIIEAQYGAPPPGD